VGHFGFYERGSTSLGSAMSLYHCTHFDLANDSVIIPGNWGKNIFEIGPNHNSWKREMALEAVRAWNFPNKPSRLAGAFACETIETIRCYKSKQCPDGFIYEVEIIERNAPQHKGDFNAVEPLPGLAYDMWSIAQKYWEYGLKTDVQEWPGVECSEILTASPLKVIRTIL
jgi:hypothetical protein